jgi:hypothetical protein
MEWIIALIVLFACIPFILWWIGHSEKTRRIAYLTSI